MAMTWRVWSQSTASGGTGLGCDWVKVKNRKHPAFGRVMDQF
jgi:hypothetical protein